MSAQDGRTGWSFAGLNGTESEDLRVRYVFNFAYLLLLAVVWPRLLWSAWRHGKYRDGWAAKFFGDVPLREGNARCVWLHAVSVGEVNLLRPILAALEQALPDWEFVISTTTLTGFDLARQKYAPRTVFYCPLDFSWAVNRALRRIRPDLLVLAELELWPNLIGEARRQGVRVAVVNGRLSARSHRGYRRVRPVIRRVLQKIDLIAVQNDEYRERFLDLGARPESVLVTGSVKFDGAQMDRSNPATRRLATLAGITEADQVFLAGSTQAPEERLAVETYQALRAEYPDLRLVIVPRHPERFEEVASLLDQSGLAWQRRSRLDRWIDAPGARVLLVDTVGELGAWWGTSHIAFVGGSLGSRGGQNMIEPAAYGAAVAVGPNTQNFRDVVTLLSGHDALALVGDGRELTTWVRRCLKDPEYAAALGRRAQQLVREQTGATQRTLAALLPVLGQTAPGARLSAA